MDEVHGWFADLDDPDESGRAKLWRPFLQGDGQCIPLDIRFDTKESCEAFIREQVLGAGMLDG